MLRQYIETIIKNEVADALGRNPDEKELKEFMDVIDEYIEQNPDKKFMLVDIEWIIDQYKQDTYKQCEVCGELYRMDDEEEWNPDMGWVCRNCEPYHDPDAIADFYYSMAKEGE